MMFHSAEMSDKESKKKVKHGQCVITCVLWQQCQNPEKQDVADRYTKTQNHAAIYGYLWCRLWSLFTSNSFKEIKKFEMKWSQVHDMIHMHR